MTALHLARPDDLEKLLPLVAAYHATEGIVQDEASRRAALMPLLDGVPQGAVWLIGPRAAPLGYIAIGTGWSIELGGMDAFIDEFFIRENLRGRGIGTEALSALAQALKAQGVVALHLEVGRDNAAARSIYQRLGFAPRDGFSLMTCRL
ncbi:GNAT family N-acetyltransferase [Sinisalibacter aestuarii]|uniref:N-acetyltransferase domain-containing protein n=1 Tax=Sinisalibacter aestuarii TaxID=2949426 RepID=A0ABQ5LRB5_9RHOB|nr:GNAT family N-acetyltransferase [Sinisalibacter aestuarii]GKY87544.1 hypothetical protein STA1M1_14130 [Sinisalibacter aestuarii]